MSTQAPSRRDAIDSRLIPGAIYVIIFLRPLTGDQSYHWGLYHHLTATKGHKYHIISAGSGWLADHATASNFMKSIFLVGLVRVGYRHPDNENEVGNVVKSFPLNEVPSGYSGLTCRTWTLHLVDRLVHAGFVKCQDINALEREILVWAGQQFSDASMNVQPRSIIDSSVCRFD